MKLQIGQVESYLAQQLQANVHILQLRKLSVGSDGQPTSTFLFALEMFHHEEEPPCADSEVLKAFSYGNPILVSCLVNNVFKRFVLRTMATNEFDHQRRSDRAGEILLGYDTYNDLPHHARALDVGMVTKDHRLVSIADSDEFFLLTEYVRGKPYVSDLQRLCKTGEVSGSDLMQARQLAIYLANIHQLSGEDPTLYTRHIRDILYGGEGIMGLVDSYVQFQKTQPQLSGGISPKHRNPVMSNPNGKVTTNRERQRGKGKQQHGIAGKNSAQQPKRGAALPGSAEWFEELERRCVTWRWRLRDKTERLAQVHGDFHPFNVLFEHNGTFHTIERSRGAWGEPADDVACMAINYLFFSLQRHGSLASPFEQLWNIFWNTYMGLRNDPELLLVIGPFFAWRALVLASPIWYNTSDHVRTTLLTFADRVLKEDLFDPAAVNQYLS